MGLCSHVCVSIIARKAVKVTVCHPAAPVAQNRTHWVVSRCGCVLYVPLPMLSRPSLFRVCVGACVSSFSLLNNRFFFYFFLSISVVIYRRKHRIEISKIKTKVIIPQDQSPHPHHQTRAIIKAMHQRGRKRKKYKIYTR